MNWALDKKRPICPQICDKLCLLIASGDLGPGDRLRLQEFPLGIRQADVGTRRRCERRSHA